LIYFGEGLKQIVELICKNPNTLWFVCLCSTTL